MEQHSQNNNVPFEEISRQNEALKKELAKKDEAIDGLKKENESLKREVHMLDDSLTDGERKSLNEKISSLERENESLRIVLGDHNRAYSEGSLGYYKMLELASP